MLPKSMLLSKLGCLKTEGSSRQIKERPFSLQRDSQGAESLMIFLLKVFQQQESVALKRDTLGELGEEGESHPKPTWTRTEPRACGDLCHHLELQGSSGQGAKSPESGPSSRPVVNSKGESTLGSRLPLLSEMLPSPPRRRTYGRTEESVPLPGK